ncbi:MAG: hypothetical protein ACTSSO_07395 [Candidatus Hodarchaeales archaeon]
MYGVSEETEIRGKETTYIVNLWDGKKHIAMTKLVCEYTDRYDEFQSIVRLLQTICNYLNANAIPKKSWIERLLRR